MKDGAEAEEAAGFEMRYLGVCHLWHLKGIVKLQNAGLLCLEPVFLSLLDAFSSLLNTEHDVQRS